MDRIYMISEIAALMKVSRQSVSRWIQEGKLMGFRTGGDIGMWRVTGESFRRFLAERGVADDEINIILGGD